MSEDRDKRRVRRARNRIARDLHTNLYRQRVRSPRPKTPKFNKTKAIIEDTYE